MKKFIISLLLINLVSTSFASEKIIRFATEPTYPPFEYTNGKGEIIGFDIDIAKAICKEINATCTFHRQSFNSLIPSLRMGKFDALIATLNPTQERALQVNFTQSYYQPSASLVAANNINYPTNLSGFIIGAQAGSTFEKYAQDIYGSIATIKIYVSVQDAFLDLIAGRVNVVITDTPIAKNWLKEHNDKFAIISDPIFNSTYFGDGYAIAINKKNDALLAEFNQALTQLKQNGTYDKLVKEYFE